MQITKIILLALLATTTASAQYSRPVDARSYNLGLIGAFAEVVNRGVKTLALSEVMSPATMDDILPDALVIAKRNGVELYRESDLLVTDLFPADVAAGKHVLLIYTGDTLDRYMALKDEKARLEAHNEYSGDKRRDLARRFGRLLSYPDSVIGDLLANKP